MTNDQWQLLLQEGIRGTDALLLKYPGHLAFVSVRNQLLYLLQVAQGEQRDLSGLASINLGLIAVREYETRDEHTANVLHAISGEVTKIRSQLASTT